MPVDTDLTVTPSTGPGYGGGSNPLGVVGGIVGLQNQILQQKLIQANTAQTQNAAALSAAQLNAKAIAGTIFAKHPGDVEGAWQEMTTNPAVAPYVQDIGQSLRANQLAAIQMQGENIKNSDSGFQIGMKMLGGALNDYRSIPGILAAANAMPLPDSSKKALRDFASFATQGFDPNEKDPAALATNQKLFVSRMAGPLAAIGNLPVEQSYMASGNYGPKVGDTAGGGTTLTPSSVPSLAGGTAQIGGQVMPAVAKPVPAGSPPSGANVGAAASIPTEGANVPLAGNGKPLVVPPEALPKTQLGLNGLPVRDPATQESVTELQKKFNDNQPSYDAAQNNIARLDSIQANIRNLASNGGGMSALEQPGPAGEMRTALGGALNTLSAIFNPGSKPPVDIDKQASAEDLIKDTINLGFGLTHENFGGGKEALGIVENSLKGVPSINNTPLGGMLVSDIMKGFSQWAVDNRNFKQQWLAKSNGDLRGSDTAFANAYPPSSYIKPVLEKYGLKPDGSGFNSLADLQTLVKQGLMPEAEARAQAIKQGLWKPKGAAAAAGQ